MKKLFAIVTIGIIGISACSKNDGNVITEAASTTSTTTVNVEEQKRQQQEAFGTLIQAWVDAENKMAYDAFESERIRLEEEERQRQAEEAERQRQAQLAAAQQQNVSYASNGSFLDCVKYRESRGDYGVVNSSSGAGGAYQFMPQTWNNTAAQAGRPDLVGVHPSQASAADQDAMAQALYQWQGASPWAGPGC